MTLDCDVIVVGGGLSGLAAADDLLARGWTVKLIERDAEKRLGGRIFTNRQEPPWPLEEGPTYIGPTQGHMQEYVRRFGLSLQKNRFPDDKSNLNHFVINRWLPPARMTFQGTHVSVVGMERAIGELDKLTAIVAKNLERPWEIGELRHLDAQSVQEWSDANLTPLNYGGFSAVMKRLLYVFLRSVLSVEPTELSMLFFLYYCARCGGFRYMVSAVDYGPDCRRIREGLDTLVERLKQAVERGGGEVHFATVTEIDQRDPAVVSVQTAEGRTYKARRVVVAMPPKASITNMAYLPTLPAQRVQLCEGMKSGRTWKGYVVFDKPWFEDFNWHAVLAKLGARQGGGLLNVLLAGSPQNMLDALPPVVPRLATGYTGYSNGDYYDVSWTMNGTWRDEQDRPALPALMWFVVGDKAVRFGALSHAERRKKVLGDLKTLFRDAPFPKTGKLKYYERDYTLPPHQSGPSWVMPKNLLTLAGPALRDPVDRIHWAGTEAAVRWGGYLEGAVDAALRASSAIDDALCRAGVSPAADNRPKPEVSSNAAGVLRCGAATEPLGAPDGLGMAGYSWGGRAGRNYSDRLHARVLYMEDAGGTSAVLCFVDLMSASRRILKKVRELAKAYGFDEDAIFIAGTHTHTAPGHFYGNTFYDFFAQAPANNALNGFQSHFADGVALSIVKAMTAARSRARPAKMGVAEHKLWGASRNRSLTAFENNSFADAENWNRAGGPADSPPDALTPQQTAVDPRVRTIVAVDKANNAVIASFATFGCHATALGPKWASYHRDWPGFAVDQLEVDEDFPGATFAWAPSALGDVSPLRPSDGDGAGHIPDQGVDLAIGVGRKVAEAIKQATNKARAIARDDHVIVARVSAWKPGPEFKVGWPLLAGAEDGRSALYGALGDGQLVYEGMTDSQEEDLEHRPKFVALGLLHDLFATALKPADWHPLHQLQIGDQLFVSVPGEPTTKAGHDIEAALVSLEGVAAVHVVACAGDYAGYYTTEEEYELQHFEGAHTLYGRRSLALLIEEHVRIHGDKGGGVVTDVWEAMGLSDELSAVDASVMLDELADFVKGGAGALFRIAGRRVALFMSDEREDPTVISRADARVWPVGIGEPLLRGRGRRLFAVSAADDIRTVAVRESKSVLSRLRSRKLPL